MLKKILLIIAGIITGTIIIYLVELVGHFFYPPPEEINTTDLEALKQIISDLPVGAFVFVLLAYALGSFGGALLTATISKSSKVVNAVIVGAVLMIFGIINLLMIPHPVWFSIVSIFTYIPCAYFGGKVSIKITN